MLRFIHLLKYCLLYIASTGKYQEIVVLRPRSIRPLRAAGYGLNLASATFSMGCCEGSNTQYCPYLPALPLALFSHPGVSL